MPSLDELVRLFRRVNADCLRYEEVPAGSYVAFTDQDYYADQIANIFDVDDATAARLAAELATVPTETTPAALAANLRRWAEREGTA